MLGLRRHTQAFSGCCEQGRLFSAVIGLPKAVASLVAREGSRVSAHGLQQLQCYGSGVAAHGLSRCGVWGVLDQGLYLPPVLCTGRRVLTHCTSREVPRLSDCTHGCLYSFGLLLFWVVCPQIE